jgi:lysozyme
MGSWLLKGSSMDTKKIVDDLKRDEGFVRHAYADHLGFLTIGYGRMIDQKRGGGISQAEADFLLKNDIQRVYSEVMTALPWALKLTEGRQRALVNMAFQMGIGGLLGFKNTLALIKAGKYTDAADNALKSKWASQTPIRARRVADLIRKG